jgi:hypothetical protein
MQGRFWALIAVMLWSAFCFGQSQQANEPQRLPFSIPEQEAYLDGVIALGKSLPVSHGKDFTVIYPFVLKGKVSERDSTVCSSDAQTKPVNTGGDNPTWVTSGSTVCDQIARLHYSEGIVLNDPKDQTAAYVIFLSCDEKFIWNHCGMQESGQRGAMVLQESGKPGHWHFNVLVSTTEKLGDKGSVAKFAVTEVWHIRKSE